MYRIAAAMDKAVVEGLIPNNPFRTLDAKEKPKIRASRREFLTVEELKVLINTPCRFDIVKGNIYVSDGKKLGLKVIPRPAAFFLGFAQDLTP